jgi:hypothetical protein
VSSETGFAIGQDLDKGNNGVLEGLPPDAVVLDSIGWSDGNPGDIVYGGGDLSISNAAPDAVTRFPGDMAPSRPASWFGGELAGPDGASLAYESSRVSSNFPVGTQLTPGEVNNTAPFFLSVVPVSGVIGDPGNPPLIFQIGDRETVADNLVVTASSTNPLVVLDTNLTISRLPGGVCALNLSPTGVGYSEILLSLSDGSMIGRAMVPYAASAPSRPGGRWHLGASDGSTAIAVDSDFMFIGDDENQTIRLYPRAHSSLPLQAFDFSSYLDLPDNMNGVFREVDVEASTRVGNRFFWMGSHGHAADGEPRTNRTRIFATDFSGTGSNSTLAYAGRYDYLKLDLINWDKQNLHGKGANYYGLEASDADGVPPKAPDGSGFSIEGLSMMPGSTNGAYVAFRAPIVPATNRTYALIVPVLNFATIAAGTGPPGSCQFGPPIELDLFGRGIRSLEGAGTNFLLVAGAAGAGGGTYPQDFRLYTWSGDPNDRPQQRSADLTGLGPEGIIDLPPAPWSSNTVVELLTDNGNTAFYGDKIPAKAMTIANFKKCRSDIVFLGAAVEPAPIITSVALRDGVLELRWRSVRGGIYRVEAARQLSPQEWIELPGDVVAPGPYATKEVAVDGAVRLFRIKVLAP